MKILNNVKKLYYLSLEDAQKVHWFCNALNMTSSNIVKENGYICGEGTCPFYNKACLFFSWHRSAKGRELPVLSDESGSFRDIVEELADRINALAVRCKGSHSKCSACSNSGICAGCNN